MKNIKTRAYRIAAGAQFATYMIFCPDKFWQA